MNSREKGSCWEDRRGVSWHCLRMEWLRWECLIEGAGGGGWHCLGMKEEG